MNDIDEQTLRAEANKGGIDGVRDYLVKRGRDAYTTKREEVETRRTARLMGGGAVLRPLADG